MKKRMIETIEVQQNLILTVRERGKVVARREGHNIWLDLGREYLAQLIAYASFGPNTPFRDDRIRYIGLGIGGTKQLALPTANSEPLLSAYPGTNAQTDDDPTVLRLERPVRLSGTATVPPYNVADVWLGQVQAPPTFPLPSQVTFQRLFTLTQVSYNPFLIVPLSEVAMFTDAANPNVYNNTAVAYDTFETLTKTQSVEIEIAWTIKF